jgi:hypothetical protein
MKVEVHADKFGPEEDDDVWIPKCAAGDLIIISGDKAIETDPINRRAVEESGAKVFMTAENNSKAEEWAAAIIIGRRKLAAIVDRNNGPFFVEIDKHASNHISSVRFAGSGGPKPQEVPPSATVPDSVSGSEQPEPEQSKSKQDNEESQRDLFKTPKVDK